MKKFLVSFVTASLAAFFLAWNFYLVYGAEAQSRERQNRLLAMQELTLYGDRLQHIVNTNMHYAEFLELVIMNNPDITPQRIEPYARLIVAHSGVIKNVALAPGGVVSHIFPLEGNEAALGHNLLEDSARSHFARQAIMSRQAVTQGPVTARQGGLLVFNRKAVFIPDSTVPGSQERLWGLTVTTLDFEELIEQVGLKSENDGYHFALRSSLVDGTNDFVWGEARVFENDSIIRTILFPSQQWELAICPVKGWLWSANEHGWKALLYYSLIVLGAFILAFVHAGRYQDRIVESLRDPLTGTFNKSAFRLFVKKRMRHRDHVSALCVMDINLFKEINDSCGHPVGDVVLTETARRLESVLRNNDRVSRFGGDEFILYFDSVENRHTMEQIVRRLQQVVSRPIYIDRSLCLEEEVSRCESLNVSLAAGFALFPEEGITFDELYTIADKRMYGDKLDSRPPKTV